MVDRIGQQLGNYHLTHLLGRGGFAEVYLGEHTLLKTRAAIKVLHTQLEEEESHGFLKEAQTIANLEHPHIVRVLDFDIQEGTPFLVVSYAPNGTLRQGYPKGTQLPLPTIISFVKQIADALQYAHDAKVIHRDIKPENMLIGQRNEVLLSDFGIATVAMSTSYQSRQDVAGTMAYMAPEQIQAHPRPASDQYSLGVVVYEWLVGIRPFSGTSIEIAAKHLNAAPPPLHERLPTISPALEEVMRTVLAKDPKQRFDSVKAFATTLEQVSQETKIFSASKLAITPLSSSFPPPSRLKQRQQENRGRSEVSVANQPGLLTPIPLSLNADKFVQPTIPTSGPVQMLALPASETFPIVTKQKSRLSWRKVVLPVILALLLGIMIPLLYSVLITHKTDIQTTITTGSGLKATITTGSGLKATTIAAFDAYNAAIATSGIMLGFNPQHTHLNPYEKVLSPTNVSILVRNWTLQTGGYIETSPAIANGVVFVGSYDRMLYALNALTGNKIWGYQTGDAIYSSPAVANGVVYVGSEDDNLYALDARTGNKLWEFQAAGSVTSSPAVANGVIYVGSWDHTLYVFRLPG